MAMVDVSAKSVTSRTAEAHAFVKMKPKVLRAVRGLKNPKGNPLEVATHRRYCGGEAHRGVDTSLSPLATTHIDVTPRLCKDGVEIRSSVTATAQTGVEMEALVAASCAALTVYDMCKALDKSIEITQVYLLRKTGGKSGDFVRATRKQSAKARR